MEKTRLPAIGQNFVAFHIGVATALSRRGTLWFCHLDRCILSWGTGWGWLVIRREILDLKFLRFGIIGGLLIGGLLRGKHLFLHILVVRFELRGLLKGFVCLCISLKTLQSLALPKKALWPR